MEYLNKLIPLAIFGILAAFLIALARRAARETEPTPRVEESASEAAREAISESVPVREEPIVVVAVVPAPVEMPPIVEVIAPVRQRRPPKAKVAPAPVISAATPIQTVLGLLKEMDTLLAAMILQEILGPPASNRRIAKEPRTQ